MVELAWQLMMGVGLAASAGLRAFLPLLVVGLAARFDVIALSARFEWMASTAALTVFALAVAIEMLGDKFPVVDHLLDTAGTFARPIAGALVAASPLTALDPLTGLVVGLVLGGSIAGSVHAAKAGARLVSSGTTAGVANPLLSMTEDVVSLWGAVLSIFVPILTFTVAVGLLYFVVHRLGSRRRSGVGDRAVG
ncbi:MAG TPA: DUF4126 domain-containing protein [Acidobacteriota bacterium]|nr:DUF4126 domain-containing protein [Acidobacteriota bacterium]